MLNMIYNYWCPQCYKDRKLPIPILEWNREKKVFRCPRCGWERGEGWSNHYRAKRYHYYVNGITLCGIETKPRQLQNDPPTSLGTKPCKKCLSIISKWKRST